MNTLSCCENSLKFRYDNEQMIIEPWGQNSLRVRATKLKDFQSENWALDSTPDFFPAHISIKDQEALIRNGKISARVTTAGKITFYNNDDLILEEFVRNRKDVTSPHCSALHIDSRTYRPILGGDYEIEVRFEADKHEKLFGMGQYQHGLLDLKGSELELAQRNSQSSVPFYISSKNYGFLWNNPAIGRVTFATNGTTWYSHRARMIDYWITADDTPMKIAENYAAVTGTVPMMPDYAMGFWQCKLRYQTQEELLAVAREYKKRNLPISVIVIDFFHWELEGEWDFDPEYWPDPQGMIRELKEMGITLMVSIWPTVAHESSHYEEMTARGLLIHVERGYPNALHNLDNTMHIDTTNPETRDYVWQIIRKNYYEKGIHLFWLDEAEPEYDSYDFDNYRYHLGTNLQIGNIYPLEYARMFYEGMKQEGQKNILNLIRCAWAGSQKYGTLVWSGDISSSYESFRNQFAAGLNMGVAGIPWWTTDIGGFHGGNPDDPQFRELFVRWFQYGTFCPVMRLHGDREPHKEPMSDVKGGRFPSGADNEVWSYGEEVYEICRKYMLIRENMKPYIKAIMEQAHEKGIAVIRTMFYQFPEDKKCWEIDDQYMFGPDILVAPVMDAGIQTRQVYLPAGHIWYNMWTEESISGGIVLSENAPLGKIPLFTTQKCHCNYLKDTL